MDKGNAPPKPMPSSPPPKEEPYEFHRRFVDRPACALRDGRCRRLEEKKMMCFTHDEMVIGLVIAVVFFGLGALFRGL